MEKKVSKEASGGTLRAVSLIRKGSFYSDCSFDPPEVSFHNSEAFSKPGSIKRAHIETVGPCT